MELELIGGVGPFALVGLAVLDGALPLQVGVISSLVGRNGVPGIGDLGMVISGVRHDFGVESANVDVWTWTCGRADVWTCGRVDVDVWTCGRVDVDVWTCGRGGLSLSLDVVVELGLKQRCGER